MSLSTLSKFWALWRTVSAYSRCSGLRGVSRSRRANPMMPFIGVRISCEVFARNWDLARADSMATSRAAANAELASFKSFSARFRAVMSSTVPS